MLVLPWNLLAPASGAPGREYFKLNKYIYRFFEPFCLQDPNIMTSVSTQLLLVLISLLLVLPVVEAVEAGDAIALLLGVVLSITGICACLGVYARKRNGQMWLWRASWIKPRPENLCAIAVKPELWCRKVPRNSK